MLDRGEVFYEKLVAARGKVAKVAAHFITDGSVRINIPYPEQAIPLLIEYLFLLFYLY